MLRRPARPARASIAALAASTVLLAGCGSATDDGATAARAGGAAPADAVAVAERATADPELAALLDDLRAAGEQVTTTRFQLALRGGPGQQRLDVTGVLDATGDSPALQARTAQASPLSEVRLVDGVAYAQVDLGAFGAGADASWVKVPLTDLAAMLPDLGDLQGSLAGRLEDGLGDVVTDVTAAESAGGTTYTVDLDLRSVSGLLATLAGSMAGPMAGSPGGAGGLPSLGDALADLPASVPVTVAFDDAGRLTRVAAETGKGSVALTLTDPGTPVSVEAPAGAVDLGSMGFTALTPGG